MKKIQLLFLAILIATPFGAKATTHNFTATATLEKLLRITQETAISFGTIGVSNDASNTITLKIGNKITASGNDDVSKGDAKTGIYRVYGIKNTTITLAINNVTPLKSIKDGSTLATTFSIYGGSGTATISSFGLLMGSPL